MSLTWKDRIYKQRKALALILRDPIEKITSNCMALWGHRESIENLFLVSFSRIPYCSSLYALDTNGIQISESIGHNGIQPGNLGRDRSQQPCMSRVVPAWGFIISDAYLGMNYNLPSITALQVVRSRDTVLGYLGADFDLRDLPITSGLDLEPVEKRQANEQLIHNLVLKKSDFGIPAMNRLDNILAVLETLLVERGVFQCHIHFMSNQTTIWTLDDPYRYQILEHTALDEIDTLHAFPPESYPYNARIPQQDIPRILATMRRLQIGSHSMALQLASINLFNGMICLTFTRNSSHYMSYEDFLTSEDNDWFDRTDIMSCSVSV